MADNFATDRVKLDSPPGHAAEVTPDNSNDLAYVTRALWVGGAGNITLDTSEGDNVTLTGIPAGTQFVIRARRIYATGTTATDIVALW